jgi:transcriptional regulator with XRE-family HTH domain
MSLGKNIQYLRKLLGITQEGLAEKMGVSRQAVSNWESDQVYPEVMKLTALSDLFHCKVDTLLRDDLSSLDGIYSPIEIHRLPAFKMARYVMISPNPESDVNAYMDSWAEKSGLLSFQKEAKRIGWDFPFVSMEQQNRFHLRGYASAYLLPDGFVPSCPGVEIAEQKEADYAVISIKDPFVSAFQRIPGAYKAILEYLDAENVKEPPSAGCLSCFEYVYEQNGVPMMDVFVYAGNGKKAASYPRF